MATTYTVTTTVNNGSANSLEYALTQAVSGDTIVFDAGANPVFTLLTTYALNGTVTFDLNGTTPTIAGSGSLTDPASGQGSLIIANSGSNTSPSSFPFPPGTPTLILTITNSYTGGTTISAGALQLGNGTTDGSIQGDVVDNSSSLTASGLVFDPAVDGATFKGVVSGTGNVSKVGTGTEILAAANSYTGSTSVTAGTLQGGTADAFGSASAVSINGGATLDLGGFDQTIGTLNDLLGDGGTVTNGGTTAATLTVGDGDNDGSFSGVIRDGAGAATALVKTGAGTQTLLGTNIYTGGTTIDDGTLQLGNGGTGGALSGTGAIVDNGTLAFFHSAGATTATTTLANDISGTGTLDVIAGTTILSGQNSYSGDTTIGANSTSPAGTVLRGNLTAGAAGALSASSLIYFQAVETADATTNDAIETSGTLDLAGTNQTIAGLAGVAGAYSSYDGSYSPATAGAGTVTNSGAGTVTLTVAGSRADPYETTFGGTITGAIALDVTGTLDLSGANTYTGGTTIGSDGTLTLDQAFLNAIPATDTPTGATMQPPQVNGSVTGAIVNNGQLVLSQYSLDYSTYSAEPVTVANDISGSGALYAQSGIHDGPNGIITLTGHNTYTGATFVGYGTLQGGVANAFGTDSAVQIFGDYYGYPTLDLDGNAQAIGSLAGDRTGTVTNSVANTTATLTVGGDGTDTAFDGSLQDGGGTVALNKVGTGTLTLGGGTAYTGGTVISAGTLALTTDAEPLTGTITFAAPGATLALGVPSATLKAELVSAPAASSQVGTPLPGATLDDFGPGEVLDLRGLGFVDGATATLNADGTVLQVVSGTAEQDFDVSRIASTTRFAVTADGQAATDGSDLSGTTVTAYGLPVISGTVADQAATDTTAVTPFATAIVADPNAGIDTLTIALSGGGGTLSDGAGYSGLVYNGADGTYTLTGSAEAVTGELDALRFTPAGAGAAGSSNTTVFTLTDVSSVAGATASDATTSVVDTISVPAPVPAPVSPAPAPAPAPTPAPVSPTPAPAAPGTVSFDDQVSYKAGTFTLTGHASSAAGVSSVAISATLADGSVKALGAAALNADGSFSFEDRIGSDTQGFITATATDAAGVTTSAQADYALTGGLQGSYKARQDRYTADGSATTAEDLFKANGSQRATVTAPGQTFNSASFDVFDNGGAPDSTFVFQPGHGLDVVKQFRVDGADHDTLSFKGADFGNSVATLLANTYETPGGSTVIVDPTTNDAVKLTGVTKQQLTANQGDLAFHA